MPQIVRPARASALALMLLTLGLSLTALGAWGTTSAHASATQLSMMMDDDLLVYRSDTVRDQTMRQMKGMGVDVVRVTVLWSVVAENANDGKATKAQKKRFKKLGADNPKAYPKSNWDRYDGLVRACKTLGLTCYLNVTGPGPRWAHGKPPKKYAKDAKWWKPNPRQFYKFVQAVSKRYTGKYRDENTPHTLPRVGFWSLWNEPNQGGWLRPQWLNNKPVAPQLYRDLYLFGRRALVSTGHGSDIILFGETAPANTASRKTTTSAIGPRTFLNETLCGPGSSGTGCSTFQKEGPIQTYAYAHHPYTKKLSPLQPDPDPEVYTLANIDQLLAQLDSLAASTGNIKAGLPLMSTEFGYETNPPDPFAATSLAQQATFNQLADLITFLNPRIIGNTQFLLRDVKPDKTKKKNGKNYWATYQSGILTAGGTEKPAAAAYKMPFLANVTGGNELGQPVASIFGQLRFLPNVLSEQFAQTVRLQYKAVGAPGFVDFGEPITVTNVVGYYQATAVLPGPGEVRAVWSGQAQPYALASLPQPVPAVTATPAPAPPPAPTPEPTPTPTPTPTPEPAPTPTPTPTAAR
ncbi:hypothetical protein DSM112329_02440 [Paraconexibacter sp. AEG42_29]|uniref:Glycoside hydrolase family 5 domain-containing protein n=1 Tax=Paraconexibacter sp. AEG42_29 TaxID=2997339 RepID=A0AAU7AV73_9ACTN